MSLVGQGRRLLLGPTRLLSSRFPLRADGGALQSAVVRRGIFGKVAGKSQSKVLSSPADGIAQIEGERRNSCT